MQSTKQLGYNLLSSVGGGRLSGDYKIFMHPAGNANILMYYNIKNEYVNNGLQSPVL